MSPALTIEPDRVIDIGGEGIKVDLCVGNTDAQNNATQCLAMLPRLRPFASQDLTSDDAEEVPGGCSKGDACGCSCLFSTPHLTSFVVVDTGAELEGDTSEAVQAATQTTRGFASTTTSAPDTVTAGGGMLVPIVAAVGAVAFIAAAALFVRSRNARSGHSHSKEGVTGGLPVHMKDERVVQLTNDATMKDTSGML